MRVIIAGSREIKDLALVEKAIKESGFEVTMVVSGGARGVDRLGEMWAARKGIPVKVFPADWTHYGKGAGRKRNTEMVEFAEALVAVWDGTSPGTHDTIKKARWMGRKVHVLVVGADDAKGLPDSDGERSAADGGEVRSEPAESGD